MFKKLKPDDLSASGNGTVVKGKNSNRKSKSRSGGRPPVASSIGRKVIALFEASGRRAGLRALAKEVGIAPGTVGRILDDAGVERKRSSSRKASQGESAEEISAAVEPGQTNLRTVAARANVSLFTASLALRGSTKVAESTRKRVEQVAAELAYQVHPYVSAQLAAVRRGKSIGAKANLAYFYSSSNLSWERAVALPYGPSRSFTAAWNAAKKRGYVLEPFIFPGPEPSGKRLQQIIESRGICGLILDFPAGSPIATKFDFNRFACVALCEQTEIKPNVYANNDFQNTMQAFCHLWKLGYRRIGYAMSDSQSYSSVYRPDAAVRHCCAHLVPKEHEIPFFFHESWADGIVRHMLHGRTPPDRNRCDEHRWVMDRDWTKLFASLDPMHPDMEKIHLALLERWLQEYQPEAILCQHNAFLPRLKRLGLRVPQDIGLAHLNLNSDVEKWSGNRNAHEAIAQAAVDELSRNVELGRLGPPERALHVRLVGDWVEGSTTRRIRKPLSPLTQPAERFIRRVLNQPVLG